jgi:hypothetical protein
MPNKRTGPDFLDQPKKKKEKKKTLIQKLRERKKATNKAIKNM